MTPLARADYEREKAARIERLEAEAHRLEDEAERIWGEIAALEAETLEDVIAERKIDEDRERV